MKVGGVLEHRSIYMITTLAVEKKVGGVLEHRSIYMITTLAGYLSPACPF